MKESKSQNLTTEPRKTSSKTQGSYFWSVWKVNNVIKVGRKEFRLCQELSEEVKNLGYGNI